MQKTYETPDDHFELLSEKGYLSENFKAGSKVGYWLREFTQEYERVRYDGVTSDQEQKFTMSITGNFNADLERVSFLFRYKYHPENDSISLWSVHARLGKESVSLYLPTSEDLPASDAIYKYLRNPLGKENDTTMFIRNYFQFMRDRDPGNDYHEEIPAFKRKPIKRIR